MKVEFKITRDDQDKRLDYTLAGLLGNFSRNYVSGIIKAGGILVSGEIKKPGYRLKSGDIITGLIHEEDSIPILPESLRIDIIHEDSHIIVVNKKAGMVVHPAPGHFSGTMVNALLYHLPEIKNVGQDELRPGIVHRLDKDTTGLMVVAKNNSAFNFLKKEFKQRRVVKKYLGLVAGDLKEDSGSITFPIGRHAINRKKMSTTAPRARHAETLWRVRKRFDGATLIEAELKTGRTHQIRVHFRAIGNPLMGDRVYGFRKTRAAKKKDPLSVLERDLSRQMLHAWKLSFRHPFSGRKLDFTACVPDDMKQLLDRLSMV